MSPQARIAVLVVAAAAVILGFVLAQSAGEDEDEDTVRGGAMVTVTAPPATGEATTDAAADGGPTGTVATQPAAEPEPAVETIRLQDGGPAGGEPARITVDSGERVRLRFRSDTPTEIHVHGYDITRQVPADEPLTVAFTADAEGVFEIESHPAHQVVAELEVRP